jgi:hypothetical protein
MSRKSNAAEEAALRRKVEPVQCSTRTSLSAVRLERVDEEEEEEDVVVVVW